MKRLVFLVAVVTGNAFYDLIENHKRERKGSELSNMDSSNYSINSDEQNEKISPEPHSGQYSNSNTIFKSLYE